MDIDTVLIKKILEQVKDDDSTIGSSKFRITGYNRGTVNDYVEYLLENKYLEGMMNDDKYSEEEYFIEGITQKGLEYLKEQ